MSELQEHIFAAYFSDARHNICLCLNDIRERIGRRPIDDEAQIAEIFKNFSLSSAESDTQDRLIKWLRRYFPFIDMQVDGGKKGAKNPLPQYYDNLLQGLFQTINLLRNSFMHPTEAEAVLDCKLQQNLFYALGKTYDAAINTINTRFHPEEKLIKSLRRFGDKGKVKEPAYFPMVLCRNIPKKRKEWPSLKHSDFLYDFGRILLCAMFLDKSQSAELLTHFWQTTKGKTLSLDQQKIIRELVTVYRVRLPLRRLQTNDNQTTIVLDSLTELARCPRQLFDLLSPDDQQQFRTGNLSSITETEPETDLAENSALMRRGLADRFVPLILRFLDFDPSCHLRFGVDLGYLYYNVRLKPPENFVDQRSKVRRLGRRIVSYGRLHEFTDSNKSEAWKQLEDNCLNVQEQADEESRHVTSTPRQLQPYIVPCTPHHHFSDERIGFRLAAQRGLTASWPDIGVEAQEVKQQIKLTPPAKKEMEPDYWITPRQLLHMAFYIHLQQNQENERAIHNLIQRFQSGITALFRAIKEGEVPQTGRADSNERRQACQEWLDSLFRGANNQLFTVTLADLPRVVRNYLLSQTPVSHSGKNMAERAEKMAEKTQKYLDSINHLRKKNSKPGKKKYRPIKCGHLADFLCEDLLRFQPIMYQNKHGESISDGGKINSQHYQILQNAVAYYGAHLDQPPQIVDLLDKAGLLSGKQAHPFLNRVITLEKPEKYANLVDFYVAYLEERKKFLNEFAAKILHCGQNKKPEKWLRMRQHSTLESWLKEQINENSTLRNPIPLPKNFFFHSLLTVVAERMDRSIDDLLADGTREYIRNGKKVKVRPAVNWLIQQYLHHKGEVSQSFYALHRRHDLFDDFLDKRGHKNRFNSKESHYLSQQERVDKLSGIRQAIKQSAGKIMKLEKELANLEQQKQQAEKEKKKSFERKIKQFQIDIKKLKRPSKQLKQYKRSELRLRQQEVRDMVLYLFTGTHLHELEIALDPGEAAPAWNLRDLKNTLLTTKIRYALVVEDTGKFLVHPHCKIKNLGELRLLTRDRRLPGLLAYYKSDESEIDQAEIRAELAAYRRVRVEVMRRIHTMEKAVEQAAFREKSHDVPHELEEYFGGGRHGKILYAIYQHHRGNGCAGTAVDSNNLFTRESFQQAIRLRNAFAHNEYPSADIYPKVVCHVRQLAQPENPANHRRIAQTLFEHLKKLYKPWLYFVRNYTADSCA